MIDTFRNDLRVFKLQIGCFLFILTNLYYPTNFSDCLFSSQPRGLCQPICLCASNVLLVRFLSWNLSQNPLSGDAGYIWLGAVRVVSLQSTTNLKRALSKSWSSSRILLPHIHWFNLVGWVMDHVNYSECVKEWGIDVFRESLRAD